jgi:hypothetical protein
MYFDLCKEQNSEGTIKLPNPWREKANGRIIRHVPVNMYCDDTSGNKSKKWNKHISYYFTLSGLPPNLSNQQFNCHFLCTSNIAGALDLGEIVVQQLKYNYYLFNPNLILFMRDDFCSIC